MYAYKIPYVYIHIYTFACICLILVAKRSVSTFPHSENTTASLKPHSVQWVSLVPRTMKW